MAATVVINRLTGAGPTLNVITTINTRCNAEDTHSTAGTSNPIVIPSSGTNYSYWCVTRLQCTVAPTTLINNLKWYCYDDKTELLTRDGWKFFRDVQIGEHVATRDASGNFQWQQASKVWAMPYVGKMLHFKSSTVDLCVTPNHRMLVSQRNNPPSGTVFGQPFLMDADWFLREPKSRTQNYMMPMTSIWHCAAPPDVTVDGYEVAYKMYGKGTIRHKPPIKVAIDDWVAFMGIFLAEGWVNRNGEKTGRKVKHLTRVAQMKNSVHWEEINAMLMNLPFKFRWIQRHNSWESSCGQLWKYLKQFGLCNEKFVPQFIKDLKPEKLEILWKWACMGDGWKIKNQKAYGYVTTSKRLADDYQEVLQKCGRDATIITKPPCKTVSYIGSKRVVSKKTTYRLTERTGKHRSLSCVSQVDYDGRVYCVTVPNGVVYVRRNGKPAWSGNTDGTNSFGTGVTLNVGTATAYTQATGTAGTTGTQLTAGNYASWTQGNANAFVYTSASPLSVTGSTSTAVEFGDRVVHQFNIATTASPGATPQETVSFRWDES